MARRAQIIEHQFWRHTSGRTASLRGSVPYACKADAADWSIVSEGYTIQWPDGTTGTGMRKCVTRADAESFLSRNASFKGYSTLTM